MYHNLEPRRRQMAQQSMHSGRRLTDRPAHRVPDTHHPVRHITALQRNLMQEGREHDMTD